MGKSGGPRRTAAEGGQSSAPPPSDPPQSPCRLFPLSGLSLLAGASGVGKTSLYTSWVAELLRGGEVLGAPARVGPGAQVGMVFGDRSLRNNRHWLERYGLEPEVEAGRLKLYSILDDDAFPARRLRLAVDHPRLFERCLGELGLSPGSLVVFDPISIFLGGKLVDYSMTAAAMIPLQQIARQHQLAVLGIHHVGKQKKDGKGHYRAQDRILGSTALLGFSDTQVWVVGPEETGRPFYQVGYSSHSERGRGFEFQKDKLGRFVQASDKSVAAIDKALRATRPGGEGLSREERGVLELVGLEPTPSPQVVSLALEKLGVGRTTIFRLLEKLALMGAVVKDGHGRWRRVVSLEGEAGA